MAQQAEATSYLDTMVQAGLGVDAMEQEIRARMAHMTPELATAWSDSLSKSPPHSLMTWALLVIDARANMRDYPRT